MKLNPTLRAKPISSLTKQLKSIQQVLLIFFLPKKQPTSSLHLLLLSDKCVALSWWELTQLKSAKEGASQSERSSLRWWSLDTPFISFVTLVTKKTVALQTEKHISDFSSEMLVTRFPFSTMGFEMLKLAWMLA